MNFLDRRKRRPITQSMRDDVLRDLPEIAQITHEELCAKTIEAWPYALAESAFDHITDIPGEANPGMLRLRRGNQADHLRSVTRIALAIADEFAGTFPEARIDRDIVIAGGMLHDVGKVWEFDPENQARWQGDPSRSGLPALRHPVYGAHICLAVGLPEEIAHIALAHSHEWRVSDQEPGRPHHLSGRPSLVVHCRCLRIARSHKRQHPRQPQDHAPCAAGVGSEAR